MLKKDMEVVPIYYYYDINIIEYLQLYIIFIQLYLSLNYTKFIGNQAQVYFNRRQKSTIVKNSIIIRTGNSFDLIIKSITFWVQIKDDRYSRI